MKGSVALVSYINTRPFIDGLNHHFAPGELDLLMLPPAECARALADGRCQMALIPVGALTDFQGLALLPDHCIGADGPVNSVFLFSEVPVEQVEKVWLDRHSRTSNGLTRLLMRDWWGVNPEFAMPETRHFDLIRGTAAGVAIGDEAYKLREQYPYVYDLSGEWKQATGLPFVFAVWAYRPEAWSDGWLNRIEEGLAWGQAHRESAAVNWAEHFGYTLEAATEYLTRSISYQMDAPKHQALRRYFEGILSLPPLS